MIWSDHWIEQARLAARLQKRLYGLETPRALQQLLQTENPRVGLIDSVRIAMFALLGHPRGRLRLFWRRIADRDTPAQLRRIESLAGELRTRLSRQSRVAEGGFERQYFSRDMARVPRFLEKALCRTRPLLVVQPGHETDVIELLAFAREHRITVTPRGASSSAFGGAVPTRNGLVLDFSCMNRIFDVDPAGLKVHVQPGVRWSDLNAHLERYGLAPVTTPSSRFSTVAGWASTGGLGMDGFGHGAFSQAILSVRVALMDGTVRAVEGGSDVLEDFLGTEGQLGVFTELTLRVQRKPEWSSPRIAFFTNPDEAFRFIDLLVKRGHRPSHVAFYDRERLAEENRLFFDRTGRREAIVEEHDAVLLHFEERDAEQRLLEDEDRGNFPQSRKSAGARYLWSERFFPLKAQRLGPGLLAAEVVLPGAAVPGFTDRARRMAGRFGVRPAIEAIVSKLPGGTEACVVIVSFPCDPARKWNYLFSLALVQLLLHAGLRLGGRPYGLGIWNAPFAGSFRGTAERRRLMLRKQQLDPHSLLNPNKFFGLRTRFLNLPGLFFRPAIYDAALRLASVLSPLIGASARLGRPESPERWLVPSSDMENGVRLLEQSAARCTSCGSCVSSCPAYMLTRDERVTGRAKLRMAESWTTGEEIAAGEAHLVFQCLQCGLCEEVCQTRLPLRDCYDILETWIRQRHGYPAELIRTFIQRLDSDRSLLRTVFGLDLPEWAPEGSPPSLDDVRQVTEAAP